MKKTTFYYGGISGILMILFFLIPYVLQDKLNSDKDEIILLASFILPLTAVFFGIRSYRNKKAGGIISFGKAFGLGSEISGTAALIFGIFTFALNEFLIPNITISLFYQSSLIILIIFLLGLVISVISAAILKRKEVKPTGL
jgi:hypothetical protein